MTYLNRLYHAHGKIVLRTFFLLCCQKIKKIIINYVQYILTSKNNADIIFKIKSKDIVANVNNGHIY